MEFYVQILINGLMTGAYYGLAALGLTLIFGVIKVINFAHGSMLMVGMFTAYWIVKLTGWHPYAALLLVVPMLFIFGYALQGIIIKPILEAQRDVREPTEVIIVTTGVWYILDNLALMIFGAEYRVVPTSISGQVMLIGDYIIQKPLLYGFITTMVTAGLLVWFLKYTKMGMSIRAASLDRDAASLMGINQYRVYNIAFGIGAAIAGIVGCVLIPFYYVFPTVGVVFDVKCFIIVVLGGLGSIPGALIGGLIVGLIESVFPMFMTSTWTELIVYVVFLAVLFIMPAGLFGEKRDW
ncbi:MAG TPA: branched-chain amino acid ABC transporter permease [Deltaproteobacteria bacterium]|nr:branched-chain amino acid ABC transporter permease [Deltaproteobacteria bacterium]HOI08324.1 branched-chain amino acid ABC transporter permease [Deltaproteobacteria bacterium]